MTNYADIEKIENLLVRGIDECGDAIVSLRDVRRAMAQAKNDDVQEINHGKWISNGLPEYKWSCHCSECGWIDKYPFHDPYNYCPDCGAKMDKKKL